MHMYYLKEEENDDNKVEDEDEPFSSLNIWTGCDETDPLNQFSLS